MFTGLVETRGEVIENYQTDAGYRLLIKTALTGLQAGESIAVNGVCLTLLPEYDSQLMFDISPETCKLTTLGALLPGNCVNIERSMLATARFGGHYVSGHVDTTAVIQSITAVEEYVHMVVGGFAMPAEKFLLSKGSITLDGVSLTINEVEKGRIHLMLVPHTLSVTTLGQLRVGDRLNVEFDYLTRVVAHQLALMGTAIN